MKLKNVFSLLAALVVLCVGAMAVAAPAHSQLGQSRAAIEVAKAELKVMKAVLLFKTLTLWNIIM